jgi:protein-S-isoprenylcysteine O-methyltransferase Ste14
MLVLFQRMVLKHLAGIVALPVTVIVLLPVLLISLFSHVLFWGVSCHAAMFLLAAGIVVTGLGLILLYSTISIFIKKGGGTIAPWHPTKNLVVSGFYSHVRNPS